MRVETDAIIFKIWVSSPKQNQTPNGILYWKLHECIKNERPRLTCTLPCALVIISKLSPSCWHSSIIALYLLVCTNIKSLGSPWSRERYVSKQELIHVYRCERFIIKCLLYSDNGKINKMCWVFIAEHYKHIHFILETNLPVV